MKKIIVGILSFVVLFSSQNAFAAGVTWNTASNDCKSLSIVNATTSQGYTNPCWPLSTVSANAGEVINVRVYYHNTGTTTATNARLVVSPNTSLGSSSTSKSFNGRIISDQGSLSFGPVTANISSSQSLTFISAKWYTNNTSETLTSLMNGQSGQEIMTDNGLAIGSIANGWASQGSVVVAFRVSNNTVPQLCQDTTATNYGGALPCKYPKPACVINSFYLSPSTITKGESSSIKWNTSNCISVTISSLGSILTSGSQTITPTSTRAYTLNGYGADGSTPSKTIEITVNSAPNPVCSITSFYATPSSITGSGSTTLTWNTSGCSAVDLANGTYGPSGTKTVSLSSTTTYTLKAYDMTSSLSDTESVQVTVNNTPNPTMTGNLTASNSSCVIASGNSTCSIPFSWTTQNPKATSAVTHNNSTVATGNNGSQSFAISNGSQTYYLYNSGDQLDTETVSASCAANTSWNGSYCAQTVSQLCEDPSATNYHGSLPCTYPQICRDTTATNYGGALPCTYPSRICTDTTATNYGGLLPCTYPIQVCRDTTATNYGGALPCTYPSRICTDTTATNYGGLLPCTYPQPVYCTISNFTASPSSITSGDASVLNWNTTNCTNVTISNLGYNVPTSGSQAVYPTYTKTYVLNAYGTNGIPVTRSTTVYVDDNNDDNNCSISDFSASDTSIEDGDSSVLRWNTNNCDHVRLSSFSGNVALDGSKTVYPSDDTTYTLTAYNTNGSTETDTIRIYVDNNNNDNNYCYINTFTTNSIYVTSGDPVTLRWTTTDCDYVNLSSIGNVSLDGSRTVYPTYTTTYTLRGTGDSTDSRSITVNVNNTPVIPVYNSNVVTTVATNISQTGAQLNGLITSTNYVSNGNVHFEYGTTVNLGSITTTRATNGNTNFSEYVSNLSPNTIYFFQAVSNGTNGVSRGAIEVFKTLGYQTGVITPTKKVVIQGPTVYASASPIMLKIEDKYQTIGVGDIVDYTVYYKNISNSTLTNPMVQVFIPQGITLINTSIGTYSASDRTLSAPIANLNPGDEGVIYLQGRVDSLDINLAQIVTTAILVYTNPNGAQENAMAYVLNNPRLVNGNVLGASAFFGNIFGMSLIGWLIIIILIMLLILLARSINGRRTVTTTTVHN